MTPGDRMPTACKHCGGPAEARRPADIEQHLEGCAACAATYRAIAATLSLVVEAPIPERGDRYGLEVWQRIRQQLPAQHGPPSVPQAVQWPPAQVPALVVPFEHIDPGETSIETTSPSFNTRRPEGIPWITSSLIDAQIVAG